MFSIFFLSACGGGDSDSSVNESIKIGDDTYSCSSGVSAAACVVANVTGKTDEELIKACVDADCSCSGPTCGKAPKVECEATTLNELGEGASCTFGGNTYTCNNGTVSGSGLSASLITLGNFSVKCK